MLDADPELAAGLSRAERLEAPARCTAVVRRLGRGNVDSWSAPAGEDRCLAWLLVLRGLLSCGVSVDSGHAREILGPGDLIRPWAVEVELGVQARWRVHEPAVVAVLDERFLASAARWPPIMSMLLERSARRSRSMLIRLAIAEMPQIAQRVHRVLWHLADRWGKVGPTGVVLDLRLSRTALAELVCARRESVSRALTSLAARGLVHPHELGYLLCGGPPAHTLAPSPTEA